MPWAYISLGTSDARLRMSSSASRGREASVASCLVAAGLRGDAPRPASAHGRLSRLRTFRALARSKSVGRCGADGRLTKPPASAGRRRRLSPGLPRPPLSVRFLRGGWTESASSVSLNMELVPFDGVCGSNPSLVCSSALKRRATRVRMLTSFLHAVTCGGGLARCVGDVGRLGRRATLSP
jgi:hypothetical protein